jgi:hypothetical protein
MEQGDYDTIRALAEKYGDIASGVDFASILAQIEELERIAAENQEFMQNVYDLMAAEDYDGMMGVDGSDDAVAFVDRMTEDSYIYIPSDDGTQTGTGAGVYQFGDSGYYFFYGDYTSGKRESNGVLFCKTSDSGYTLYTGEWKQEAPNGQGELLNTYNTMSNTGEAYSDVMKGSFKDGLVDGDIKKTVYCDGITYEMSFDAVMGVPTEDKTEEFFENHFWEAMDIPEGKSIYAYDDVGETYVYFYLNFDTGKLCVTGFTPD